MLPITAHLNRRVVVLGLLDAEPAPELKLHILEVPAIEAGGGEVVRRGKPVFIVARQIVAPHVCAGVARARIGRTVCTARAHRRSERPSTLSFPAGVIVHWEPQRRNGERGIDRAEPGAVEIVKRDHRIILTGI